MLFGIDGVEFILILVLAIVILGPEKMPQYARKAARLFVYLKDVANNTQASLREQLGPEYADLQLADMNPKAFVKKHLSQEIAALEEAKRDIEEMKQQLKEATVVAKQEVADAKALAQAKSEPAAEPELVATPYDDEAT